MSGELILALYPRQPVQYRENTDLDSLLFLSCKLGAFNIFCPTMAGMGHYLCCEALHVAGIHPQHRPADLSATQLRRLTGSCLRLIRQSYETGGITNDLERATTLRKQGAPFEVCRFHVYRRAGLSCYRCGTGIIKGRFCGRMGYLCPTCQRQPGAGGDIRRE